MEIIWATRGKHWGHKFLLDGGYKDPLPPYLEAFSGFENSRHVFERCNGHLALRFPDPEERHDESGRLIYHDLVISGHAITDARSYDEACSFMWPLIADEYSKLWDAEN